MEIYDPVKRGYTFLDVWNRQEPPKGFSLPGDRTGNEFKGYGFQPVGKHGAPTIQKMGMPRNHLSAGDGRGSGQAGEGHASPAAEAMRPLHERGASTRP